MAARAAAIPAKAASAKPNTTRSLRRAGFSLREQIPGERTTLPACLRTFSGHEPALAKTQSPRSLKIVERVGNFSFAYPGSPGRVGHGHRVRIVVSQFSWRGCADSFQLRHVLRFRRQRRRQSLQHGDDRHFPPLRSRRSNRRPRDLQSPRNTRRGQGLPAAGDHRLRTGAEALLRDGGYLPRMRVELEERQDPRRSLRLRKGRSAASLRVPPDDGVDEDYHRSSGGPPRQERVGLWQHHDRFGCDAGRWEQECLLGVKDQQSVQCAQRGKRSVRWRRPLVAGTSELKR